MNGVYRVFVYVIFFCCGAYAAPGVIKDTLACLKDEHKDLSLMHGSIASETRVIERMADYGTLGYRGDKIPSETVKLVSKLFHRPSGSSGPAGFLVTKPLRELSDTKVAEWVASELVFFKCLPQRDCFKLYQAKRQEYGNFIATHGDGEQKKIKQLEKSVGNARRVVLEAFDTSSEHPPYESPLKELAHYPIKAFLECSNHEYMPVTMPQTILLALLYKKTEGESAAFRRAAFRTYYELLDKRLSCLAYPLPVTWEQEIFSLDQRDALLAEIKNLPAAQAYERAIFLRLSPTDYPSLLSYDDVTLHGAAFTDCMENTFRNLSNFLAYNQQTGLFDCELLERRLGTRVHESVKRFYEQYADPATAAQKGVHNAWAELLATLPNHVYCRALPPISHQKKDCILVVPETSITIELCAKKGYVSLPPHTISYDMRPALRNFILTCEHLFGLQLFKDLPADAWAREGFITEQLPRVIEALKARVPETLDCAAFEYHDGSMIPAFVPLTFSFTDSQSIDGKPYDFTLTLHTEYDDGEVLFNRPPTETAALPLQLPFQGESRLLLSSASEIDNSRSAEEVLAWLFTQDLASNCNRYALVQHVPIFNERILELLLFSTRKYATGDEQILQVLRMYQESLQRGLIGCDAVVKTALNEAVIALRSKNTLVRGEGLHLFKILFEHNKGVEVATSCAATCLSSVDKKDVSAGLSLLKVLAGEGKAFEAAETAVQSVLKSPKILPIGVRFEATQLYENFVRHRDALGSLDAAGDDTAGAGESLHRKRISWKESLGEDSLPQEIQGDFLKNKSSLSKKKCVALMSLLSAIVYTYYKYVKDFHDQNNNSNNAVFTEKLSVDCEKVSMRAALNRKRSGWCDNAHKETKRESFMKRLAVFVGLCSLSGYASVNNIKETYTILKPEFRDFSIIHGAVAAETDFLPALYDLRDERKKSATVNLVQKLFHATFRRAGLADFVATKDIRHIFEEEQVPSVAYLLLFFHGLPTDALYTHYSLIADELRSVREQKKRDPKTQGIVKKIDKLQRQRAKQRDILVKKFTSSAEYTHLAEPFQKLVPAIIEAHLECMTEKIFSPETVQLILLALLYKEIGGDKRFVRLYYELLHKKLQCLDGNLDAAWEASQFTPGSIDSLIKMLSAEPLTGNFLEKHFEEYVFVHLARAVPLVRYKDSFFKGHEFGDCMDTVVRNLLNNLSYNPDTKRFDVALLEQRLGSKDLGSNEVSVKVSKELKNFYTQNSDPALASDKVVHNKWAEQVSSNIPFVAYRSRLANGVSEELPQEKRGFIKGIDAPAFTIKLIEKGYVPVDDTVDVFTVRSGLKNLIVMLDYLLHLNLFESGLEQEFLRDDFVATYLPKLANALHATLPIITDVDKRDFSDELLATTFDFNFMWPKPYTTTVTLLTERRHSAFEFCPLLLTEKKLVVPEPLQLPYPLSLPLLVSGAEKST